MAGSSESRTPTIDGLNCAALDREQIQRTLKGGVTAINFTSMMPYPEVGLAGSLTGLEAAIATVEANDDIALIARSVADIETAGRDGRLAVIMGTQNSAMIEDDLDLLATFKRLGVGILQPTYSERNAFGYGALFEGDDDQGITEAGRAWIAKMHELNLVVDLSHCGHRTTSDYLANVRDPMVISHSNAYALCRNPRNKTDQHARAIADTGGLIGVVFFLPFIRQDRRGSIEDAVDHIDHFVNVAGIDHVGFSSDMDEGVRSGLSPEAFQESMLKYPNHTGDITSWYTFEARNPIGYDSLTDTPAIWEALRKRGYSSDAIDKVRGGNWLRVLSQVWGRNT